MTTAQTSAIVRTTLSIALLMLIAVLTSGCTAASAQARPLRVDWNDRPAAPIDLGDGWSVQGCEGDAPFMCIEQDDQPVGTVELVRLPRPTDTLPDAEPSASQLRAQARAVLSAHVPDRREACPDDHDVTVDDVALVEVAGGPGARYGFTVTDGEGTVVERVIGHLTVDSEDLVLIVANARTAATCVVDEEFTGFAPDTLQRFAPHLDRIAARSVLDGA